MAWTCNDLVLPTFIGSYPSAVDMELNKVSCLIVLHRWSWYVPNVFALGKQIISLVSFIYVGLHCYFIFCGD